MHPSVDEKRSDFSVNATYLAFVRIPVCRKSGKKTLAKARRRKVNELTIVAPLREKFHAAIFLLLRVFKITLQ